MNYCGICQDNFQLIDDLYGSWWFLICIICSSLYCFVVIDCIYNASLYIFYMALYGSMQNPLQYPLSVCPYHFQIIMLCDPARPYILYLLGQTNTHRQHTNCFHQLGPLGRVGLVVDMSVGVCVCVSVCPLPMRFFSRPLIGPQIGPQQSASLTSSSICNLMMNHLQFNDENMCSKASRRSRRAPRRACPSAI